MTAVYALHRALYADDEAQYLAQPANYREAVQARQRLAAAEVALSAQISTLLRVGPAAAVHVVEVAVGLIERLPKVFGLIGANVITPKAAETVLGRSRVLTAEQVRDLDAAVHDRLTVDYEVLSIPALRDEVDLLVRGIDPEAAERRRALAEQDRKVVFRPADDGMATAFALLPAPDMQEISARVDYIATTVCADDPRTVSQRQADGIAQLIRGYSTLGCACANTDCRYRTARFHGEPDADGAITRFITLINVVINEQDLTDGAADASTQAPAATTAATTAPGRGGGLAYLEGHGPISVALARALAAREDAVIRPFGRRITNHDDGAAGSSSPPACGAPDGGDHTPTEPRGAVDVQWAWRDIVARLEGHHDPGDTGFDPGPDGPGPDAPDGDPRPGGTHPPEPLPAVPPGAPPALVRARGSSGYRPSADLRRYLRLIHPRCVFPHCNRPAARAQIDHRREYDHTAPELGGQTTAEQIQPLCISHHQLKTAGQWIDARLPDGRILWTAPDGRRYIVDPTGIMLQLFPDLTRIEWDIPTTASPETADTRTAQPGGRTRLQREHARRERRRRDTVTAFQADKDRKALPNSEVEIGIMRIIGMPHQRPAPTFDSPPPY
ncbi:HNH endonuclease signature motif containing protein [Tsukamurella spumae]